MSPYMVTTNCQLQQTTTTNTIVIHIDKICDQNGAVLEVLCGVFVQECEKMRVQIVAHRRAAAPAAPWPAA
jgi:hypothetical protein